MAAVRTTRLIALRTSSAARMTDGIAHVPPDTLRHLMAGIRWAVALLDPPTRDCRPDVRARRSGENEIWRSERYLR